jgi:hypothetical protein
MASCTRHDSFRTPACAYADRALNALKLTARDILLAFPDELASVLDAFRISLVS